MINGTSDSLVRYDGGAGRLGISGNAAPLEAAAFMAGLNGCASVTDFAMPAREPADPTSVTRRVWNGCKPGGGVEFYTVKGGGHQAPVIGAASSGVVLEMFLGTRSHQIDTAETMWDFFKRAGQ